MSHSIAPSRGFSGKTLAGVQIGELHYRRLSLETSKIHYKRLSIYEVWIEDNITMEDKL